MVENVLRWQPMGVQSSGNVRGEGPQDGKTGYSCSYVGVDFAGGLASGGVWPLERLSAYPVHGGEIVSHGGFSFGAGCCGGYARPISTMRGILQTLAASGRIQNKDSCSREFQAAVEADPLFLSTGLMDQNFNVLCTSRPDIRLERFAE